jgi:Flp pilus assembly pilin Flp
MEASMQTTKYEPHAVFRFFAEESGASLMEYVLIAAIISVIGALIFLALSKEK